jgi:RHS repeat-associated protein
MTDYQHNAANRLVGNSSYTYTYDNNGNLTGQTHKITSAYTAYAYTTENQLKQVTLPDNSIVTFKYDPLGRRIEKTTPAGTFRYVYDNEDIIAVLDGNNTQTQTITHGPGIDEPLILKNADTSANYYYHADGLGSITALTNEQGAIAEAYEYQAYGKPVIKDHTGAVFDASPVGNFYLFTAREYDHETGLFYYRARYYSPETGRFLQEDPIHMAGMDLNLYRYALSNPVNLIDPSGLKLIYKGTWRERILIWWAIFKLRWNSPAAKKIIDDLERNSAIVEIQVSKINAYSPHVNICSFDPQKTHIYDGSQPWHHRPSEIGLGHELIHALHDILGRLDPQREEDITVGVMPHDYIGSENNIRGEYGLPKRPRY